MKKCDERRRRVNRSCASDQWFLTDEEAHYNSQSHARAQMGNCDDLLFSIDFSQKKTTNECGINELT